MTTTDSHSADGSPATDASRGSVDTRPAGDPRATVARPAAGPGARSDARRHPLHVAEVRLGRAPQDFLQTAVVLEAWAGRTQVEALPVARRLRPDMRTELPRPLRDAPSERSGFAELVALAIVLASALGWIGALETILDDGLSNVIVWALPLALGVDRALRLRYPTLDTLRVLRHELPRANLAMAALIAVMAFVSTPVLVGLCLVVIWGEAPIFVLRGRLWQYAAVMGATSVWFAIGGGEQVALLVCAGAIIALANHGVVGEEGDRVAIEAVSSVIASALIGLSAGVMITADLDIWIGADVPTVVSVLYVSFTGWWAASRLSETWTELRATLQRQRLRDRTSWTGFLIGRPLAEALLRLGAPMATILVVYAALGEWQTMGLVGGFGMLALAMMLTGLVTAMRAWDLAAALFVAGAVVALITPSWFAGSALLLGATVPAVGAAVATWWMLRDTAAAYATRLMIG